jgi:hypothetical protein
MGPFWDGMSFFRWPLSLCLLFVLILALRTALKLYRQGATAEPRVKGWLNGILAWGFLALMTGIHGWVTGIILALQATEAAGIVRGTIIAPGIKLSLLSLGWGAVFCGLAVFLWLILQLRWGALQAAQVEASP